VGLSTAYHAMLRNPNLKVALLEKENAISKHQTGRNSGVIHSGIYYKPGSQKALNCKKGYDELINFCNINEIKYDLCGKIIVATSKEELPSLTKIYNNGLLNGLDGIKKINSNEILEIEPHCVGIKGIYVPQTGIIDYKNVSMKYAELFLKFGGEIYLNEKVVKVSYLEKENKSLIKTEKNEYFSNKIVNCSGLYSDKVAKMINKSFDIQILPFRGEYYNLKKEKEYLVKNLIYPVPNPNFPFLGVHFTRMINGGIEAGPNAVLAYAREGYSNRTINLSELIEILTHSGFQKIAKKYWRDGMQELYRSYSKNAFTSALQKLIPEIHRDDLYRGNSGVRAQACDKSGTLHDDFIIFEHKNTINVCNAPSPAATSSFSIGESIGRMLKNI